MTDILDESQILFFRTKKQFKDLFIKYTKEIVLMKKLKIYKDNNEFIIEQINELNHSFKKKYITENGFFDALNAYKPVIEEYDLSIQQEEGLSKIVTNFLMSEW